MPTVEDGRWTAWWMWWLTHALTGGTARVLFDVGFPYLAPPEALSGLLASGTLATVVGKLLSGPICTALGAYK